MTDSDKWSNPQLRPIEAFPMRIDGRPMTCLRDPQGLAQQPVFLNGPQAFLVSMMDGAHTLREIQAEFFRRTSELLPLEVIENLVRQLDEHHFLDSASFRIHYNSLVQDFRRAPVHAARHAGTAYEKEETALRRQLEGFFTCPEGPGAIERRDPGGPLRGLIAPHIDFHRGGPAYAHAYKALAEHADADRFIVFGTCHNPMDRLFALTDKDYETPLGPAPADEAFLRRLTARLPQDYLEGQFAHRAEHSIEFQAVWLRYVVAREFTIIPILVGSFQRILAARASPSEHPEIAAMIAALKATIAELPGRYCVIAGADLAHVGRQFGDAEGPSRSYLEEVELADREFLQFVEHGDAEGAVRLIAEERDRRRVCGYPPIYMALRSLEDPRGKQLAYRQWTDEQAGAAVTFASVAIF